MEQEEIFRQLLLVLLMGNQDSDDCTTFGRLNNILIIGLLLQLGNGTTTDTTDTMTTF